MDNIKTIIFDLDNTLIDLDKNIEDALKLIFEKLNLQLTNEHLDYFHILENELWSNYSYNGIEISKAYIPTKRFEIMFKYFGIKYVDYNLVNELFKEGLVKRTYILPEVINILKLLKINLYKIFILTNGLTSLQRTRIENSELIKFTDKIYVSEEIGYNKPNFKSFEYVLKDNKLNKDEVIMIGDSLFNDIAGANNYGNKTIWCNFNKKIDDSNIMPTLEINHFIELKDVFNL